MSVDQSAEPPEDLSTKLPSVCISVYRFDPSGMPYCPFVDQIVDLVMQSDGNVDGARLAHQETIRPSTVQVGHVVHREVVSRPRIVRLHDPRLDVPVAEPDGVAKLVRHGVPRARSTLVHPAGVDAHVVLLTRPGAGHDAAISRQAVVPGCRSLCQVKSQ